MPNENDQFDALMRDYASRIKRDALGEKPLNDDEVERIFAACKKASLDDGAAQEGSRPKPSWIAWLFSSWRPFALGGTAVVAAILMLLVARGYFDSGDSYTGQIDPLEMRGTVNLLPLRLHADFNSGKIELRGKGIELNGSITPLVSESSSGTNVYQLNMSGKDSEGKICTITNGRAFIVLKIPGGIIEEKKDTSEVRLEGRLDVQGQGNYQVRRTYLP